MSMAIQRRKHLLKVQDVNGKTVLDYAVEEERDSVVEMLLKADNTLAYLHDKDGVTPLHIAASKGFFGIIQIILELSPQSITIRDKCHGQTALHIVNKDHPFLEKCLKSTRMRELINEPDNDGNTPLHLAFKCSDFATAQKLLKVHGINFKLANKQGYIPIDLCTSHDKMPLKLKCSVGADSGWKAKKKEMNMEIFMNKDVVSVDDILGHGTWDQCLTYQGPYGDNILHLAAKSGNMKFLNRVHECKPACLLLVSSKNSNGETPLHLAAESGHLEVVKHILSTASSTNDCDINPSTVIDVGVENMSSTGLNVDARPWRVKSANGDTPAHKAIRNKHDKTALHLLRWDPEMISFANNEKESLLYLAVQNSCLAVFKFILSQVRELDDSITSGSEGQNVIHAAARCPLSQYCRTLAKRQPSLLQKVDDNGKTALHHAIERGYNAIASFLLKHDKSAAFLYDNEGFTPLLRAAALAQNILCINVLLRFCPQCALLRDLSNNRTAVHLFNFKRFYLRMCMKHNAMAQLVNEVDRDGNTPLHHAILHGMIDKAQVLLETQGIDVTIANKQNQLPVDVCQMLLLSDKYSGNKGPILYLLATVKQIDSLRGSPRILAKLSMRFKFVVEAYTEVLMTHKNLEKLLANMALASTILLTITFAAAFTVPGGYDQNHGNAVRMKEAAVKVFIASDVLAMIMAFSILVKYTVGVAGRSDRLRKLALDCFIMLVICLTATLLAFISGVYAVGSQYKSVVIVPIVVAGLLNLILSYIPEFL